jgi:hypothetical protein
VLTIVPSIADKKVEIIKPIKTIFVFVLLCMLHLLLPIILDSC